nr:MAG TPA: hypothetical protein [Caudoviricetes sp.]
MTACGYRCIIILYSYVRLCFICVPCKWGALCPLMCVACPGFPVICRNCPVYISIRAIQLYCDMLIYAAFVFLSRFIIAVNKV